MPEDVRELSKWHQLMADFKEFADQKGADFQFNVFPKVGKESITVRAWFRPRKEKENGKSN